MNDADIIKALECCCTTKGSCKGCPLNNYEDTDECQLKVMTEAYKLIKRQQADIEKQIPFKPKEYEDKYYACKCGNILLMKWKKYNTELTPKSEGLPYCLNCGQALDWSDT